MNKTRLVFVLVVVAAVVIVGVSLLLQGDDTTLEPEKQELLEVRVACALPVEEWVRGAAESFNAEGRRLNGVPIAVQVTAVDGLTAKSRFDRGEFDPVPTVWIPDSRYLVELVNLTQKQKLGRDVFLTDGEYRARPIATSLFTWGIYSSRAQVLEEKFGTINWRTIYDAATARGGWPELGGEAGWGYFKLVVPNPQRNVGGLAAMVAAAGEYHGTTRIGVEEVAAPEFQTWLGELMGAVTDFSSLSAYSAEDLALFGYSMGDGGQLLESDLLSHMEGIQARWQEPLRIIYPEYITWFDFPFTIWMGQETTAAEKNAALE
ncbi:MAG: solute-binding protein, partial [Anaerolineae bacterium]|nr:solute-binding protein [Anaerolineae bacterium]